VVRLLRFAARGDATRTSPVAAREVVPAGAPAITRLVRCIPDRTGPVSPPFPAASRTPFHNTGLDAGP
jgi:hypothetical protein